MGVEGFEPPKAEPADLQSVPFDRSGKPPKKAETPLPSTLRLRASAGNRTPNLLITNQLLCRLSYASLLASGKRDFVHLSAEKLSVKRFSKNFSDKIRDSLAPESSVNRPIAQSTAGVYPPLNFSQGEPRRFSLNNCRKKRFDSKMILSTCLKILQVERIPYRESAARS